MQKGDRDPYRPCNTGQIENAPDSPNVRALLLSDSIITIEKLFNKDYFKTSELSFFFLMQLNVFQHVVSRSMNRNSQLMDYVFTEGRSVDSEHCTPFIRQNFGFLLLLEQHPSKETLNHVLETRCDVSVAAHFTTVNNAFTTWTFIISKT